MSIFSIGNNVIVLIAMVTLPKCYYFGILVLKLGQEIR